MKCIRKKNKALTQWNTLKINWVNWSFRSFKWLNFVYLITNEGSFFAAKFPVIFLNNASPEVSECFHLKHLLSLLAPFQSSAIFIYDLPPGSAHLLAAVGGQTHCWYLTATTTRYPSSVHPKTCTLCVYLMRSMSPSRAKMLARTLFIFLERRDENTSTNSRPIWPPITWCSRWSSATLETMLQSYLRWQTTNN